MKASSHRQHPPSLPDHRMRQQITFQFLFFVVAFASLTNSFVVQSSWSHERYCRANGASTLADVVPSTYDATLVNETFRDLYQEDMPEWLIENCELNGWLNPTLIQKKALDSVFFDNPSSVVIQAQTGSGKTLTYLLPMLSRLENRASIQAMIIVPTRELGLQVASVAKKLAGRRFMIMSILQGSQHRRQRAWAWAETPQVVIGTPTEMLNMVQYAGLPRINSVEYVVVDEVDACLVHSSNVGVDGNSKVSTSSALHTLLSKHLSPTFQEEMDIADVVEEMGNTKKRRGNVRHRQTLFCSATIPQHRYFLKQCKANQWTLEEPVFVCANPGDILPPTLKHAYVVCSSKEKKLAALRRFSKKIMSANPSAKVLVFCDSRRPMEDMAKVLAHDTGGEFYVDGQTDADASSVASVLRMEDSLTARAGATAIFSYASTNSEDHPIFRIMLTTDLAARGLDILGVSHVIHFDLPGDSDAYLHRSGRAGRFGQQGQVMSIITPDQEFVVERLANVLSVAIPCAGRQKSR